MRKYFAMRSNFLVLYLALTVAPAQAQNLQYVQPIQVTPGPDTFETLLAAPVADTPIPPLGASLFEEPPPRPPRNPVRIGECSPPQAIPSIFGPIPDTSYCDVFGPVPTLDDYLPRGSR